MIVKMARRRGKFSNIPRRPPKPAGAVTPSVRYTRLGKFKSGSVKKTSLSTVRHVASGNGFQVGLFPVLPDLMIEKTRKERNELKTRAKSVASSCHVRLLMSRHSIRSE